MGNITNRYIADEERYKNMQYNRVGKSGLKFPAVSLGFWHNFGTKDSFENMKEMCRTAFDCGITQFDLANNYGPVYGAAEMNLGNIIEQDFRPYRDELIIATKAGYDMWEGPYGDGGSRKYLMASIDQSLKRLKLDYVDIFYHHRMDKETPLEETMETLADIVRSGKALYAGVSNYDQEYTKKAAEILKELHCPFVVNQRRYSIFDRTIEQDGVKDFCRESGIGIIAFSPLAQGMLTDKYLNGNWSTDIQAPYAALIVGNRTKNTYVYPTTCTITNSEITNNSDSHYASRVYVASSNGQKVTFNSSQYADEVKSNNLFYQEDGSTIMFSE